MSVEFTESDKDLIQLQITQTDIAISEDVAMQNALEAQYERVVIEEALNKKIWDYFHYIIHNYERAVQNVAGVAPEGRGGEFITSPLQEADVVALAGNAGYTASGNGTTSGTDVTNHSGRLYQGIVSTSAKVIPEMIGKGLSSGLAPHELEDRNYSELILYLDRLITPVSASATIYSGGAGILTLRSIVSSGWVLGNSTNLMLLGSYTTRVIPGTTPITVYDYVVTRSINGTSAGGSLAPWAGFSNTERTSPRVATSASQSLMNELVRLLVVELTFWQRHLKDVIIAEKANQSPNLTNAMRQVSIDLDNYLTTYISGPAGAEQCFIHNGTTGMDGLRTEITNRRNTTGPALITRSKKDKELFYSARISYTNMRADIQRGSLTTVVYLEKLLKNYPDPFLAQKRDVLALWKKQ